MLKPIDAGTMAKEPWDTEWAADLAAEALAYLARHYPECASSEASRGVLREHEAAAYEAAMDADEDGYREVLRAYMRAGRDAALRLRKRRKGAA